ncbi:MAG: DUF1467 family protein [Devosia sp.]
MSIASGLAIYFVIWWITLFAVLPFGDRSPDPSDARVRGAEGSAPAKPRLWRKVWITTLVSLVLFAALFAILESGLTLDDIPLPNAEGITVESPN